MMPEYYCVYVCLFLQSSKQHRNCRFVSQLVIIQLLTAKQPKNYVRFNEWNRIAVIMEMMIVIFYTMV